MIFIFSSARSGSTWFSKIFDSHPDVLYLHEPDIADRGLDLLPFWFEEEPTSQQIEAARHYLARLVAARSPRATGTRPFFRKRYRSVLSEQARKALIYCAKGSERIGFRRYSDRIHIPDLADRGRPEICVMKSVSSLGRVGALIKAADGAIRPILLIRHPCGFAGSMIRGSEMGVMKPIPPLGRLLDTHAAKRLVSKGELDRADEVEKLAWTWLLANAEAYAAIQAAGGATVIYETLAGDVVAGTKRLFGEIGLSFATQTEAFLRHSSASEGSYYSVFRDPAKAAHRWRTELGDNIVTRVREIATRDPVGQLFFAD